MLIPIVNIITSDISRPIDTILDIVYQYTALLLTNKLCFVQLQLLQREKVFVLIMYDVKCLLHNTDKIVKATRQSQDAPRQ